MSKEPDPRQRGSEFHTNTEQLQPVRLTHGQFYLAMKERPDWRGLGMHDATRDFFVGQERAYQKLSSAITDSPTGSVIVLSEPFGSGKDALLDVVTTDLMASGRIQSDEVKRIHGESDLEDGITFEEVVSGSRHWAYGGKPSEQDIQDRRKVKTLVVNDVAHRWGHSKEKLQKMLSIAGQFLGTDVSRIIVMGDHALEDPEIVGALKSPHEPIRIKLDPLTPDSLKAALRQRIAYVLECDPATIDTESLFDPDVLNALIPQTEYPVANMRGALVDLQGIGMKLKPTEKELLISREMVGDIYAKKFYDRFWDGTKNDRKFFSWIIEHITEHGNGKEMMRAMTVEEIINACPISISASRYEKRIIQPMRRQGVLVEVAASPTRYLPTVDFFLASLKQYPLNADSELGRNELGRIREEVNGGLIDEYRTLIKTMQELYGWDNEFCKDVIQEYLDTYEERERAYRREVMGHD